MASTPHATHVHSAADFEQIKRVHRALVTHVCAGVDDQLSSLVSGEEGKREEGGEGPHTRNHLLQLCVTASEKNKHAFEFKTLIRRLSHTLSLSGV